MTNRDYIINIMDKYCDTLVIDNHKVVILRGWTDGEDDYYWMFQDTEGKFYESSCVMHPIFLKDKIDEEDYNQLKKEIQYKLDTLNQEIL